MIFFVADLHLGHSQILHFQPKRKQILGETIELHDASVIQRINEKCGPNDILFVLGDFCLLPKKYAEYRKQIHCKTVVLVLGNHDHKSIGYYYKCGFAVVAQEMTLKIAGEYVRIRHHPYRIPWYKLMLPWVYKYKERDRKKRPIDRGHFLIHGHTHGEYKINPYHSKSIHVGLDGNKFYPVSLVEIEGLIAKEKAKNENKKRGVLPWVFIGKIRHLLRKRFRTFQTRI